MLNIFKLTTSDIFKIIGVVSIIVFVISIIIEIFKVIFKKEKNEN